jgi:putative spermidine/putrescine transport system ATP-binding protein
MVTHDQEEALTMADRLVLMADGAVRQVGRQRDLYERPADQFVAGFVGRRTLLAGAVESAGTFRTAGGLTLRCRPTPIRGPAALGLRPERLSLGANAMGLANELDGAVEFVSYLGDFIDVHVRLSPADRVIVQVPNRGDDARLRIGDRIAVGWPPEAAMVFADRADQ